MGAVGRAERLFGSRPERAPVLDKDRPSPEVARRSVGRIVENEMPALDDIDVSVKKLAAGFNVADFRDHEILRIGLVVLGESAVRTGVVLLRRGRKGSDQQQIYGNKPKEK